MPPSRNVGAPQLVAATALAGLFGLAVPRTARALEPEVSVDTAAQFYDVRSPTGETVVLRRRLTSTLSVATYDLMPRPPLVVPDAARRQDGPELLFRARLRYDADYGGAAGEASPNDYDRLVAGFNRLPVDLMLGYVEGRRLLGGLVGFRLGRQLTTDALGYWAFDGALVRVTTPAFLTAEVSGGLEARGGLPLTTPRFERGGIVRADRSGYDAQLLPWVQPATVAPAFGAALESNGLPWLHSRLAYRRVLNTGASNTSQFASGLIEPVRYEGTRLSQERIGYSIEATAPTALSAKAGLAYDFYAERLGSLYASADTYVSQRVTLSVDYDYFAPTYDADSIFNFFAVHPMNDVGLRAAVDVTDRIAVAGGGGVRVGSDETKASAVTAPGRELVAAGATTFDGNGFLTLRRRVAGGVHGARGTALFGREGHRTGGEAFFDQTVWARTVFSGRASVYDWADRLRPERAVTSVGVAAGVGYLMSKSARTQLELQLDTNRLVGLRNRVVLWFTVATR